MSKKCHICGKEINSGVVCHLACADMAAEYPALKERVDQIERDSELGKRLAAKGYDAVYEEAVRLLELSMAGRLVEIPEGGFDVNTNISKEQLGAIITQNIALSDMILEYTDRMKDGRIIEVDNTPLTVDQLKGLKGCYVWGKSKDGAFPVEIDDYIEGIEGVDMLSFSVIGTEMTCFITKMCIEKGNVLFYKHQQAAENESVKP